MAEDSNSTQPEGRYLAALSLAALGVVYGDIGTSPLYAFRESFRASYGIDASAENVLGVLSLIFWSLVVVISVKYLVFVMRADNQGEGGIMALTALVAPRRSPSRRRNLLVLLGLFGAALLYGDSMITPAISVLSAVEGLEVATPFFRPYVIPITIGILLALFAIQRRGTAGIGKVFGPVTLVWFLVLAFLGIVSIFEEPYVLTALNPIRGVDFFVRNTLTWNERPEGCPQVLLTVAGSCLRGTTWALRIDCAPENANRSRSQGELAPRCDRRRPSDICQDQDCHSTTSPF